MLCQNFLSDIMDAISLTAINEDRIKFEKKKPVKEYETFSNESLHLEPYDEHYLGGSGVNVMVGLRKYNFSTGVIGAVGLDQSGGFLISEIQEHDVSFGGIIGSITSKTELSGIAYILTGKDKNRNPARNIRINPGINDNIRWCQLEEKGIRDQLKNTRLVHLSSFACAFDNYNSLVTEIKLAHEAKKLGKIVSLSGGMLYAGVIKEKMPELIDALIKYADIIFWNEEEVQRFTDETDLMEAAGKIIEKGVGRYNMGVGDDTIVVITRGKEGCYVDDGNERLSYVPERIKGKIETTGAGDAFTAGFLAGFLKDKDLEICAKWGSLNAAQCIQVTGAVDYKPSQKIKRALKR